MNRGMVDFGCLVRDASIIQVWASSDRGQVGKAEHGLRGGNNWNRC